jgi:hypothetical protein
MYKWSLVHVFEHAVCEEKEERERERERERNRVGGKRKTASRKENTTARMEIARAARAARAVADFHSDTLRIFASSADP